jgi:hypothetical protein
MSWRDTRAYQDWRREGGRKQCVPDHVLQAQPPRGFGTSAPSPHRELSTSRPPRGACQALAQPTSVIQSSQFVPPDGAEHRREYESTSSRELFQLAGMAHHHVDKADASCIRQCEFPTAGFKVTLKRKAPQGINPKILILERVVTAPSGHVIQVVTVEHLTFSDEVAVNQFTEVTILPDGVAVPVKDASGHLSAKIFKHWGHSREEDAGNVEVYRPEGFAFPVSLGRDGFTLSSNGEFIQDDIGLADGVVHVKGLWELRGPNEVAAVFKNPDRADYAFVVVAVDDAVLRITRIADERGAGSARKTFAGTSKSGDLQEALDHAIVAATQAGSTIPDFLTEWRFAGASGKSGGFAAFQEVTVTIDATYRDSKGSAFRPSMAQGCGDVPS